MRLVNNLHQEPITLSNRLLIFWVRTLRYSHGQFYLFVFYFLEAQVKGPEMIFSPYSLSVEENTKTISDATGERGSELILQSQDLTEDGMLLQWGYHRTKEWTSKEWLLPSRTTVCLPDKFSLFFNSQFIFSMVYLVSIFSDFIQVLWQIRKLIYTSSYICVYVLN